MTSKIKSDAAVTFTDSESDGFEIRIAELITLAGSVSKLARMAGISESVVRKWRDGKSDPSRLNLVALSEATGVAIAWLTKGEGPMRPDEAAPALPADFDRAFFARVLTGIERGIQESGHQLAPDKKIELAFALYDIFRESDKEPSTATILPFLRVGAK
ncbi:helix-turn-helix domain-containing protein [Marinobacterium rhizophilum]|uniref:Helix-turn-helix transcriptional regulator n=1 Tax=Marinobacterium rhizophilum TaxID=420402 RepID=A0ABY5HP00_9GAMM|nr:helix-turn-helix transcriptional regulator [Marinobacterium rhizophilum]UTW12962.1 helix-turn-helix transcriptional regulator [Marinobacterium rhizophilum]